MLQVNAAYSYNSKYSMLIKHDIANIKIAVTCVYRAAIIYSIILWSQFCRYCCVYRVIDLLIFVSLDTQPNEWLLWAESNFLSFFHAFIYVYVYL